MSSTAGPIGPDTPVSPPPPGWVSNFDNPDTSAQTRLIVEVAVTMGLALIFILLRLYTRVFLARAVGKDDYVIFVATISTVVFNIAMIQEAKMGLGLNNWDIRLAPFMETVKLWSTWNILSYVMYITSIALTKISILLLYLRVLSSTQRSKTRFASWGVIVFISMWAFASICSTIFSCRPVKKLWLPRTPGSCAVKLPVLWIAQGTLNIISDILTLCVPIPMVWRLELPKLQKLGVMVMITTGVFVTIVSVIRLALTVKATKMKIIRVNDQYPVTFWTVLEVNLGVICVCIPALKQLAARTVPYVKSLPSRYSGSGSRSGTATHASKHKHSSSDSRENDARRLNGATEQEREQQRYYSTHAHTARPEPTFFSNSTGGQQYVYEMRAKEEV
ncbi:MAG: hypothetical protein M1833_006214 [Piccolia ochrophora]|nr:MAG: hypothetical protein M1833_006214 [Piccolia ochrophora]